uniref:hypothetical protein n=1 Tax=Streptomyces sp. NRRL F-5135 TaxID=1463858 RepID=UPI000560C1EB
APEGINWRSVNQVTRAPDGTTTTRQIVPEWVGPKLPEPLLNLVEVDDDGDIVLHLPGRNPLPVSEDEFLALLDLDPALRTTPLGTPVLFLTSGPGVLSPELVERFSQRTGRPAYSYSGPLDLTAADPSAPLTIVALPEPDTNAPGNWTKATRQTTSGTSAIEAGMDELVLADSTGPASSAQLPDVGGLRIGEAGGSSSGASWSAESLMCGRPVVMVVWCGTRSVSMFRR